MVIIGRENGLNEMLLNFVHSCIFVCYGENDGGKLFCSSCLYEQKDKGKKRKKNQPCSTLVKSTKCAFSSSVKLSHPPTQELANVSVEACCNYVPPNQSR